MKFTFFFFSKKKVTDEGKEQTEFSSQFLEYEYYMEPGSVTAYDETGKMLPFEEIKYEDDVCKKIFKRPVKAIISIRKKMTYWSKAPFSIKLTYPQ